MEGKKPGLALLELTIQSTDSLEGIACKVDATMGFLGNGILTVRWGGESVCLNSGPVSAQLVELPFI